MILIKDVFFDLDRTLWDFEMNSKSALNIVFDEFNLNEYIENFNDFLTHYNTINGGFWKKYAMGEISKEDLIKGRFSATLEVFQIENEALGMQMNDRYLEISPFQTHLFPGAKKVLTDLKNQNYRLHIITNGFKEVQHQKIERSGLSSFFDMILCSEEVGKNKPHPDVFIEALKRSQTKAVNSVMIGDDFQCDIIGAESVGFQGILFDPNDRYNITDTTIKIHHLDEIPPTILGI